MVFINEEWNDTGDIVVYSNYHKYWLDRERRIKNPLFDVFSGKILDLKQGKPEAIRYFYNLIDAEICKNVTVCVVPSSDSEKEATGIDKLATGGARDRSVHMQSITTLQDMSVQGDVVLLMDDVTTTGNSLYACKEILMSHGADKVEMFALGKAI